MRATATVSGPTPRATRSATARARAIVTVTAAVALFLAGCGAPLAPGPDPTTSSAPTGSAAATMVVTVTATPPPTTRTATTRATATATETATETSAETSAQQVTGPPTTTTAEAPPDPYAPTPATVQSVHDGDTLTITTGDDVRVLGINTPEVPPVGQGCYGAEATAEATRLADGQAVTLARDPQQPDRDLYGRLLRYVQTPSGDLGELLLAGGFAEVYTEYPVTRTPFYLDVQAKAFADRRGRWGVCGE